MECKKVKFATEKGADDYIKRLKKTSTRDVKPIRAYMCPYCKAWHLTSRDSYESVKLRELNEKVKELNVIIDTLNTEIKLLKHHHNKEANVKVNKDKMVQVLNKSAANRDNVIKRLREDNNTLIAINLQLQNKLSLHDQDGHLTGSF